MEADLLSKLGSYASIAGIFITIIGAGFSLFALIRVNNLKKEFLFSARGPDYLGVIEIAHKQLTDLLKDYDSFKDNNYTVREAFKGMEETLSTLLKITPKLNDKARSDMSLILDVIKRSQSKGTVLNFDDYKRAKESLTNIKNSLPHSIENQKFK